MPIETKLRIKENRRLNQKTYLMVLESSQEISAMPGQFLMLKPNNNYDPLNRRAFAIADIDGDNILIYYDIVGRATSLMKELKKGDIIEVLLPLGNGIFKEDETKLNIVLAGGIGISGVSLFCKLLKAKNIDFRLYYGARSKEDIVMLDWFEKYNIPVNIYTEDGSMGEKGFVTKALENYDNNITIHACGPNPMLKSLKTIAKQKNIKAYLSLENPMACGYGVCLGCVVKTSDGYIRTCVEGPVLDSDYIEL